MLLGFELFSDAAHYLGHALLGFIGPRCHGRFFGDAAELAQEPGLAYAALTGDAKDEAAAGVFGGEP